MSDFPYLFICYLKPGKGTPFGRKLPEKAIIWVITCDQAIFLGGGMRGVTINVFRVVTKISSCRANTTSRRGIKQLGISFGSIFLPFSYESSGGKCPALGCKMTALFVCVVIRR